MDEKGNVAIPSEFVCHPQESFHPWRTSFHPSGSVSTLQSREVYLWGEGDFHLGRGAIPKGEEGGKAFSLGFNLQGGVCVAKIEDL